MKQRIDSVILLGFMSLQKLEFWVSLSCSACLKLLDKMSWNFNNCLSKHYFPCFKSAVISNKKKTHSEQLCPPPQKIFYINLVYFFFYQPIRNKTKILVSLDLKSQSSNSNWRRLALFHSFGEQESGENEYF